MRKYVVLEGSFFFIFYEAKFSLIINILDFCSGDPDISASNIIKLTKDDFLLELYKYWVDGVS